jgi:hypothetical protein
MKKTFLLMTGLCTLVTLSTKAQFQRGTIMLGANVGTAAYTSANSDYAYDNASSRSTTNTNYTFSGGPQIGVFIASNVVVGGSINYSVSNNTTNTTLDAGTGITGNKTTATSYTVNMGPFLRVYFANHFARNLFYMQADGHLGTGSGNTSGNGYGPTTTNNASGDQSNIFTWDAGGSLGMTHFFNKHVGMDIHAGYTYTHSQSDNANTANTIKDSNGAVTTTTNNYTLATGTSGVTLGITFHWFFPVRG